MDTFLISKENICYGYSLEVPRRGTSNEYHNICFPGEIRNNSTYLELPILILKVPISTVADDIFKYFPIYFPEKIRPDISCELSASQTLHMKCLALISEKKKKKKKKKKKEMSSAILLLSTLMIY